MEITYQKDGFQSRTETYFELPKTDILKYLDKIK